MKIIFIFIAFLFCGVCMLNALIYGKWDIATFFLILAIWNFYEARRAKEEEEEYDEEEELSEEE